MDICMGRDCTQSVHWLLARLSKFNNFSTIFASSHVQNENYTRFGEEEDFPLTIIRFTKCKQLRSSLPTWTNNTYNIPNPNPTPYNNNLSPAVTYMCNEPLNKT
mmetsp:Transcript_42850/g.69484  ORF Transcript_42850/g.69484 Transcript_42850/m.69484 type:complete len:104 (-) Transcript_42850:1667-1978(-)